MKLLHIYWWIFGVIFILSGVLQGLFYGWQENTGSSAFLITIGIVVLIVLLGRQLREAGGPRQNERTKKIGAWGLSYSWFFTFITLSFLFWLQYLRFVMLDFQTMIICLILVMAISARLFHGYLFRRGDVG